MVQLAVSPCDAGRGRARGIRRFRGGFSDPQWLAQLDVCFARLYFEALRNFLSGRDTPGCWSALFARRNETSIARVQFALAGINAHINHDLPIALVRACLITGIAPQHDSPQYTDYTALNSTLDSLVDSARQELHVRLLGDPLPAISHLEETLAAWSVAAARESAWTNFEILQNFRGAAVLQTRFLDMLDGLTTVAGKTLLVPVPQAPEA